ncbi:hypothetical protein [Bernardetia sp.]|uniref:hypothetical protein n=1 Tax=Bernardetia sp. TaxID=1937974 RepID=UPI0025C46CA3|nr:hypothetical protein [Bernardetia sp.]
MILKGKEAEEYFDRNIDKTPREATSLGYFKEGEHYIAFDDTSGELFTEALKTEQGALDWLNMNYKKEKVEQLAMIVKMILQPVDLFKDKIDMDFLNQCIKDMSNDLQSAQSIGFVVGKRREDFEKGEAELNVLKALKKLIEARIEQRKVAERKLQRDANLNDLNNLVNIFS